ncbi:MAG TPA: 6-bladed beta-propeller [Gemmatimonadaceae bacterium]|nr:6-bladed beta-propeller [Gemmatimonadaceae bacterium]
MSSVSAMYTLGAVLLSLSSAIEAQDTVRIRADGAPAWGPKVGLIEELAIGQVDGPKEYAFGRIFHAAPARDGSFYLYDANDRQIRRYDARGRFTGLIGRSGGGPGEYQHVGGMVVNANDVLVVFDPGSRRVSHFGPDGKLRREVTLTRSSFDAFTIDSAGRMYFVVTAGGRMAEGPGVQQQYLRLSPDGKVLDSIAFPRLTAGTLPSRGFALSTSDGMRMSFIDENHVAPYLAGGLVAAASGSYRLVVNDGSRRVLIIERKTPAVRLSSEERAQWLEFADTMKLRGAGPYDIPQEKPFLRHVRSDHSGRIWAEVYTAAEKRTNLPPTRPNGGKQILFWRERTTYDVFSSKGQYLGRVTLPEETVLLAIQGNRLYTRGRGPDDEERLAVYRLAVPDRP